MFPWCSARLLEYKPEVSQFYIRGNSVLPWSQVRLLTKVSVHVNDEVSSLLCTFAWSKPRFMSFTISETLTDIDNFKEDKVRSFLRIPPSILSPYRNSNPTLRSNLAYFQKRPSKTWIITGLIWNAFSYFSASYWGFPVILHATKINSVLTFIHRSLFDLWS